MVSDEWELGQQNEIKFVMVTAAGANLAGIGNAYTIKISKPGNTAFVDGGGTKQEIGSGWYRYVSTAAEADTPGSVAIYLPSQGGAAEQNLEYVVKQRTTLAIAFTYTVTHQLTGLPIAGVGVAISVDLAGNSVVWKGITDAFGVARDDDGALPYLDPGTYYFWSQKAGLTFTNPDAEVVS